MPNLTPTAEQIIADIVKQEMVLDDDHVWILNQNRKIPNTDDLFLVVGMVDSRVLSSVNTAIPTEEGMTEVQQVITYDNIQIDLFSRNNEALKRRWEVIAALNSVYSIQKQEEKNIKIFTIPRTFANTSGAEGGSLINRYSIIITCQTWYRKEKVLQSEESYFDSFDTRVDDEKTIGKESGLIEFTIESEE